MERKSSVQTNFEEEEEVDPELIEVCLCRSLFIKRR